MWAELALNESKRDIIRNWFTFFLVSSPLEGQQGVHLGDRDVPRRGVQLGGRGGGSRSCQHDSHGSWAHTGGHPVALRLLEVQDKAPSQLPVPPVAVALWVPVPTARHPYCWNLPLPSSRRRAALQRQLHV